jgi:DnaK suppressor protein
MAASAGKKTGTRAGTKKVASKTKTAKAKVTKTKVTKTKATKTKAATANVPSKAKTKAKTKARAKTKAKAKTKATAAAQGKAASKQAARKASTAASRTAKKTPARTAKAKTMKASTKSTPTKKAAAKKTAKAKAGSPKAKVTAAKKTSARKAPPSKPAAKKKITAKSRVAAPSRPSTRSIDSPFRSFTPHEPKKGESYMSEIQIAHFRNILMQWRQDLMEEVDRTVHHMRDEAANFPDPADRATQEEEFSIELRTRDRERKLIKKIDQTLERVDQRDFGYCDTCGVEIGLRRLEARPTATQCVDCKALDEIKERQLHG